MIRTVNLDIRKGEYLSDALRRNGKENIPTRVILNKVLPGLGATYCEIMSERSSIIIEPNVPVIVGKTEKHKNLLGVYRGVKTDEVARHIRKHPVGCKIMVTPESFRKVKQAMEDEGVDMYNDFFMLFDECEKIIQDNDFRETIGAPLDDFFLFRQMAFVSATPILPRDPRFEEHGFTELRVVPDYNYRKPLRLITTNNVVETLAEVLTECKSKVCIFVNSIDTIESLYKEMAELKNSTTFCSTQGIAKLRNLRDRSTHDRIADLKRYNFFTSRFFSAVDIDVRCKPDIILLSDLYGAEQSVIDPRTEAIQIAGRFRNGFRSLTHIASIKLSLEAMNSSEVDEWLSSARQAMTEIREKSKKDKRRGYRETYMEAAVNLSYLQFVYQNGKDDYFRQDNFREQERVKSLYRSADNLFNAYRDVPFFEVSHEDKQYPLNDNDRLARHRQTSRKLRRMFLLEQFEKIAYLRFSADEKEQDRYNRYLSRMLSSDYDCMFHECYLRKGADYIRSIDFKDSEIKRAVEEAGSTVFRKKQQVKEIVEKQFRIGEVYMGSDISVILSAAYRKVGLPVNKRVNTTVLKEYFELKEERTNAVRYIRIVKKK
ncbi:MAG: hypothetical protein LUD46_01910 [Parabacteroides sp.]|nr:hypothetical protein [Parabacteroides sp.]